MPVKIGQIIEIALQLANFPVELFLKLKTNRQMNSLDFSLPTFYRSFRIILTALVLVFPLLLAGCATIGHEFPAGQVSTIKIGETTQNDIYTTFGAPWRTGIDNGMKTWTYGHYRYSLFNEGSTEDLVIKFDSRGVVSSYVFNTSKRAQ